MIRRGHCLLLSSVLYGIAAFVAVSCPSGCASGLDGARQALAAAQRVQTETITSIEAYDAEHQAAIVAVAKSKEEGEKALLTYRFKRAQVVKVVLDAAAVTAVGATLIPLVERGLKKQTDLNAWLADLLAAGLKIKDALATFSVANFATGQTEVIHE